MAVSGTAGDTRPELVFTFPAKMGGVSSLNYNLLKYTSMLGRFRSKVVLLREEGDTEVEFLDPFAAEETVRFSFSRHENRRALYRRLGAELGTRDGAIVTDNVLTMGAAAYCGCPKTVFHYLHDFWYVQQNILAGTWVDVALSHSNFFVDAAFSADPAKFAGRTFYLPYGVSQDTVVCKDTRAQPKLVFLGRLVESKGVRLLPQIDRALRGSGVVADWRIIGKGPLRNWLEVEWPDPASISFASPDTTEEVFALLGDRDIFVFPTAIEGTPVAILEALSHGIVTVVSDLPGGIRDIVSADVGVRVPLGDPSGFAEAIVRLCSDREALRAMQDEALSVARTQFDIRRNADAYFELFLRYAEFRRANRHSKHPFGMLDHEWIPNSWVRGARTLVSRRR